MDLNIESTLFAMLMMFCVLVMIYQYCSLLITGVEDELQKNFLILSFKCQSQPSSGYKPEVDFPAGLKTADMQRFQEIISPLH